MASHFMPAAPTPPTGNMASSSDQQRSGGGLLDLLKFSTQKASIAPQPSLQQHYYQPQQSSHSVAPRQYPLPPQPTAQGQHVNQPSSLSNAFFPGHQQGYQQGYQQGRLQQNHQGHFDGAVESPIDMASAASTLVAPRPVIHAPAPSNADPTGLLAALMRGGRDADEPKLKTEPDTAASMPMSSFSSSFSTASPGPDSRTNLLNLLNRTKPSQTDPPPPLMMIESTRSPPPFTPQSNQMGVADPSRQPMAPANDHNAFYSFQRSLQEGTAGSSSTHGYGHAGRDSSSLGSAGRALQQPSKAVVSETPVARVSPKTGSLGKASYKSNEQTPIFQILKKPQASPSGSASRQAEEDTSSVRARHDDHEHEHTHEHDHEHDHEYKHDLDHDPPTPGFESETPTPTEPAARHSADVAEVTTKPVSEAVKDIAGQVEVGASEALARAESEQITDEIADEIADDVQEMFEARTQNEFQTSAHAAAQAIKKELDREEAGGILQDTREPELAQAVRDIVDKAVEVTETGYGVADSWESADADQEAIVVIEEDEPIASPVLVYNFPMKPWTSITLVEGRTEPRPVFSDKVVMNVAKLKKDFDQIDRNLYTATQNYMTYGMSKAGGFRVVCQADGRDAKVFTDTKDRIFNVAMTATPPDHEGTHKEAIVGTGISGTVYWVQIMDGEKDHIGDAHLEQYGFALPPMPSQDGDTPGGTLKTRARVSSSHPEFFAVGRGKTINVIWPSFILANNLLKPGHDRVVDTAALAKQCSLRINTGKAGKDFSFSHDDSVVVSLDKSGRVKFWDVTGLTAAQTTNPSARFPQPLHTAMEVTEPLMTLPTTPDGEKAWPTSVTLLDKQKPYSKQCALRYLIVGMKQNHTIQLWDLALGKLVQEFNLPHSKESDAVCSVLYQPATGMIIIGHPTRNSVYFAHLSAPKYLMKQVSQADYVRRLAAGDKSFLHPDSTAVISGVREYSFANRGILRSLDILVTPTAPPETNEEPPLFELYAMHSKGVAVIPIRQTDLGWSNDNKVVLPVDALERGAIIVDTIKPLQVDPAHSPNTTTNVNNNNTTNNNSNVLAINEVSVGETKDNQTADFSDETRAKMKDALANNSALQSILKKERRGGEFVTSVKARPQQQQQQQQQQDSDVFAQSSAGDKTDKKSRAKKKVVTPNTMADNNNNTNGAHSSPRATPALSLLKSAEVPKSISMTAPEQFEPIFASMEARINKGLGDVFNSSLQTLHAKLDEGQQTRDATFDAHQSRLLQTMSEVLNGNTQAHLRALIVDQFQSAVVPVLSKVAGDAVVANLDSKIDEMSRQVQAGINASLPGSVYSALQTSNLPGEVAGRVADHVSAAVASTMQRELGPQLIAQISQEFSTITMQTCRHVLHESRQQWQEQADSMNAARMADAAKIEQLFMAVTSLTDMVSTMASSQAQFQDKFIRMSSQNGTGHVGGNQQVGTSSRTIPRERSAGGLSSSANNSLVLREHERVNSQHSHGPSLHDVDQYGSPQHLSVQHFSPSIHGGPQEQQQQQSSSPHSSTQAALSRANAYMTRQATAQVEPRSGSPTAQVEMHFDTEQFEKGILSWIQSRQEQSMFENLLHRYNPTFMAHAGLPALVLLSVASTVSTELNGPHIFERIAWMECSLDALLGSMSNGIDEQVSAVMPKVIGLIHSRVENLFTEVSRRSPQDQYLRTFQQLLGKLATILQINEQTRSGYPQ